MKSVASSLQQAFAYINVKDLFLFNAVKNMSTKGKSFHKNSKWMYIEKLGRSVLNALQQITQFLENIAKIICPEEYVVLVFRN